MRLILFADLQAAEKTDRCFSDPATPLQRWRVTKFYEWLYALANELEVDGVVDAGDTTDRRDAIALPTIHAILAAGAKIGKRFEHNFKVQGNHDHHVKDGSIHNGEMFSRDYRVVSDGVSKFELPDGTTLVCAPFSENTQKLAEDLLAFADKNAICVGHFQVAGAEMNSGVSEAGVPLTALRGYAFTILGHVHKPQTVCKGVHYVGSPFQQDYGESGEDKRVALIDTKKLTVEWIPVEGFPVYRVMELEPFLKLKKSKVHPEDRFRVRVSSVQDAARIAAAPLGRQAEPEFQPREADRPETQSAASWNLQDAMRAWVKSHPFDKFVHPRKTDEELGSDELIELGKSALSQ